MTKERKRCKCGQYSSDRDHKKVCPARFEKIVPRDHDISLAELAKSQKALKDIQASKATEVWAENIAAQNNKMKDIIAKPSVLTTQAERLQAFESTTTQAERVQIFESAYNNSSERPAMEAIYGAIAWPEAA